MKKITMRKDEWLSTRKEMRCCEKYRLRRVRMSLSAAGAHSGIYEDGISRVLNRT